MDTEQQFSFPGFSLALDRTAQWVEAQAAETYDESPPPSPSPSPERCSQSNRTTVSSDQSFASPSTLVLPHLTARMQHTNQREDTRAASTLPFPRSPPGSGYPVPLKRAPPRADRQEDGTKTAGPPKKKRTSSLLESIKAFSTPSVQWRREETAKRG